MTDVKALRDAATIPAETELRQAFYVDVCRAEDRMKEFIKTSRALLDSLPQHWHGEAEDELRSLCEETDAVLNPHMHPAKFVEIASRRYSPVARSSDRLTELEAEVARLRSERDTLAAQVKGLVEAERDWLKKQVLALCEGTAEAYHEIGQQDLEGKEGAYARGRCFEAKSIARAIGDVCHSRKVELAAVKADKERG